MAIQDAPRSTSLLTTEAGGVDPETGKISFSQSLVAIPVGSSGLSLDVTLDYDNLITEDVITWNAEAPTGPAGLGWAIRQRTIFRDTRGTGTTLDDRLYLLDGELLELIPTANNGGTWTYQAKNNQGTLAWEVRYFSAEERWTVVKPETGHTLTFGGAVTTTDGQKDSAGHAIEWAVRYGAWMGSTVVADGEQFAVAWNVRTVAAADGAALTYGYQQTRTVTGSRKTFTQACYTSTITASTGPAVAFVYAQKEPAEIPPSRAHGNQDAYQFRYQTLFLQQLVVTEGGTTRSTVDLTYGLLDPMAKRLLTGIAISADPATGAGPREVALTYYGTDAADGVTVTMSDPNGLFNAGTEALYGSLKTMKSIEDGVPQEDWQYRYAKVIVGNSERTTSVFIDGENPRVFYGPGYLVLAYEDPRAEQVMFQVYEWDNRWEMRFRGPINAQRVGSIDDVKLALSENFFVAAAPKGRRVMAVRRNGSYWQSDYFSTQDESDEFQVASGDELFAMLDTKYGKLYRWRWSGTNWQQDSLTINGGADDDYACGMTANRGFLLTAEIQEESNVQARCRLFYLDPLRQWQEAPAHTIGQLLSGIEVINVTPGEAFALVDFNTDPLISDNHTYALVNWNADYSGMTSRIISTGSNTQIAVAGSAVNHATQNAKNMYRYNGTQWDIQRLDNLLFDSDDRAEYLYPDFTLATDNTSGVLKEFKYYSYDPYTRNWSAQREIEVPNEFNTALLKVIALAAKLVVKLALLGVPKPLKMLIKWVVLKPIKAALKAVVRAFTSSGVYQYQDTGSAYLAVGNTSGPDQLNLYQQSRQPASPDFHWRRIPFDFSGAGTLVYDIMSQVDSFFVWMTEDGNDAKHNWVTLLRNGQVVTLPDGGTRLTLDQPNESLSTIPDEDQPLLYTPDTIVAYQSDSSGKFNKARVLRLYRVVQDGVSGPVSDFVATATGNTTP
jgi:hypothetical protein